MVILYPSFFITQRNLVFLIDSGPEISGPKTVEEVYGSITKPYDCTEGYHFLMKVLPFRYVSKTPQRLDLVITDYVLRFEKNDILRIVRALAIFRPSIIALQMPFSEEDEIFVEKCVQRSVIVCGNELSLCLC